MGNSFTARYEGYAERVRKSLREQPFMDRMLGAEATRIAPGFVEIVVPVTADLLQPHGNVHGVIA